MRIVRVLPKTVLVRRNVSTKIEGSAGSTAISVRIMRPSEKQSADALKVLDKVEAAFAIDFRRRNGKTFRIVSDAILNFSDLVDAGDADAMAFYLEQPNELLLALVFALTARVKALEARP